MRITPTCVGNTQLDCSRTLAQWDHPHLRGEYMTNKKRKGSTKGSPPLAWGILSELTITRWQTRITPTCVGNTG